MGASVSMAQNSAPVPTPRPPFPSPSPVPPPCRSPSGVEVPNRELRNLSLQDKQSDKSAYPENSKKREGEEKGMGKDAVAEAATPYPQRPGEPDCAYYLRTGTCRFGASCRFNHHLLLKRNQDIEKENGKETYPERAGLTKCKYFLSGSCKFGKDCKYLHEEGKSEVVPVELNFLGLPIRLGEKDCPYYMRTGGCKYGSSCRYHHPDPIAVGVQDPHSGYQSNGPPQPRVSGAPPPSSVSWPLQNSNGPVPIRDSSPSYLSEIFLPPQGPYLHPQWNGYQVPVNPFHPPDISTIHAPAPTIDDPTTKADGSIHQMAQVDEYPERPGQKECQYFMKTGGCKFKSFCKFHHPKS